CPGRPHRSQNHEDNAKLKTYASPKPERRPSHKHPQNPDRHAALETEADFGPCRERRNPERCSLAWYFTTYRWARWDRLPCRHDQGEMRDAGGLTQACCP